VILLNGKRVDEATAAISPLTPGFQFGVGAFTTMRVRGGRVEFLELHRERLTADAGWLGLAPVANGDTLRARCEVCIEANGIADGGLKIIWFADEGGRTSEIICPRAPTHRAEISRTGMRLKVLSCGSRATSDLARHKTLNYLEHLRGKRAAAAAGFDDGFWVTDAGVVLEGTTCSLFAVVDGRIVTPALRDGVLPGVARRVVMSLGGLIPVSEEALTLEKLKLAEEVFATNALLGVVPVGCIDAQAFPITTDGVTRSVQTAFERAATA
jgi:branched-subunit amino acid aminotransferase/4-amino-4-deoxychorismate lyase